MKDKKKLTWVAVGILIVLLLILLWFLFMRKEAPILDETGEPCLIFQGSNENLPCYREGALPIGTTEVPDTPTEGPEIPEIPLPEAIFFCDSAIAVERDGCVMERAIQNKDETLCDYVTGYLAKTICERDAKSGSRSDSINFNYPQEVVETPQIQVTGPTEPTGGVVYPTTSYIQQLSTPGSQIQDAINEANRMANDPRYTAEGYYDRLIATSTHVLYAVMPYESKPGDNVRVYGEGFPKTGNTMHIGSYEIENLTSDNAMDIYFTIPESIPNGIYEVWVTNTKGSTRKSNQQIRLSVTSNPKPVPTITGITPANPTISDTVKISGENLTNIYGVYTTLGEAGKSLSFKLSDLELVSYITSSEEMAGALIPVYVYVVTDVGFNSEPFVFNVQF